MARCAYVDGVYSDIDQPAIYIEDRGYQFAEGVYEVLAVRQGHAIDIAAHLDRLDYSLSELAIAWPVGRAVLLHIVREIIRRNRIITGLIYIQVSRGVGRRDHVYPKGLKPVLVVTGRHMPAQARQKMLEKGSKIVTKPDLRWLRPDIKSTSLLANTMTRNEAKRDGYDDAWMVDQDGYITEATAANAWIVDSKGVLRTRPADRSILRGVTRTVLLEAIKELGLTFEERPFTVSEAEMARECFATASTLVIMPVVSVNGHQIGNGTAGRVTLTLAARYDDISASLEA
jgi:D-alanine transaminase